MGGKLQDHGLVSSPGGDVCGGREGARFDRRFGVGGRRRGVIGMTGIPLSLLLGVVFGVFPFCGVGGFGVLEIRGLLSPTL